MDDCGICDNINKWAKQAQKAAFQHTKIQDQIHQQADPIHVMPAKPIRCPPDYIELGRATWTFLHTMAAYYPEEPSQQEKKTMHTFLHTFAQVYPCKPCAQDFAKDLISFPPDTTSRNTFSQWMCRMHNRVNEKLGKSSFDCSRVLERWRYGSNDCIAPPEDPEAN